MNKTVVLLTIMVILPSVKVAQGQTGGRLVLPNPKLLGCSSADCSQLWPQAVERNAIFPKQLTIDMDQGCVYGLTALYDKSVPLERLASEIDVRYKQWSVSGLGNPILRAWRVEDQKLAIQLTVASKQDEERNLAEAGTRQVIYLSFGGKSACGTP